MLSYISPSSFNLNSYNQNLAEAGSTSTKFSSYAKMQAIYAKKGESIYKREMDLDKDGVISFDELHEYCRDNNADIQKLLKNWTTYRTGAGTEETPKAEENNDNSAIYAKKGDNKYDAVMDSNDDGKITYREYMEYCRQNAKEEEETSKVEVKNEDGVFEITNTAKAISAYTKTEAPEGKIETVA